MRRRWLEAVGGFDTAYTRQEDVELAARLRAACGLRFVFDFAADGLHRPSRTFDSWLRIPHAYGALDARRVRGGLLDEGDVRRRAAGRSRLTRALARLCAALPAALPAATALLRALAVGLHRRGAVGPALAALSGLYNACYAEAFRRERAGDGGQHSGSALMGVAP